MDENTQAIIVELQKIQELLKGLYSSQDIAESISDNGVMSTRNFMS